MLRSVQFVDCPSVAVIPSQLAIRAKDRTIAITPRSLFRAKQRSHSPQQYLFGHPSGHLFNGSAPYDPADRTRAGDPDPGYEAGGLAVATPLLRWHSELKPARRHLFSQPSRWP